MISGIYYSTYTATLHIRITVLKHTGYKNIKLMQGYTKKNCTLCLCNPFYERSCNNEEVKKILKTFSNKY